MLELFRLLFHHFDEIFGLLLLMIVSGLIILIAIGHVEEKTSYGLMPIIVCFSTIAGAWCNYKFGRKKDGSQDDGGSKT